MYRALLDVVQRNALPMPVTQVEMTQEPPLNFRIGPMRRSEDALCGAMLFRDVLNEEQRTASGAALRGAAVRARATC